MKFSKLTTFWNSLTTATLFFIIAAIFGLLFVYKTPLFWGEDEITHFDRAYQVSRGHMLPVSVGNNYGGYIPKNAYNLLSYVTNDLARGSHKAQANNGVGWFAPTAEYRQLANNKIDGVKQLATFPNTAPYAPVAYLPASVGLLVAEGLNLKISQAVYLARFCALVFYIACVYFVLRSLEAFRVKWIIFTIALLPMSVYQASTITADTMTIATIIVISALALKALLAQRLSRAETIVLLAAIALLPLVKPTYVLFILVLLFVPVKLLGLPNKIAPYIKYGVIALSGCLFLVWSYLTRKLVNAPSLALPYYWAAGINPKQQMHFTLHHPITVAKVFARTSLVNDNYYLNTMIGAFGYNNILAPGLAIVSSLTAMILSVLHSERLRVDLLKILGLAAIVVASIVALYYTFYLTITPVGGTEGPVSGIVQGLMGRYFIPYLILGLVVLGHIFKPRLNSTKETTKTMSVVIVGLVLTSLVACFVKYYYLTWG